MIPIFIRRSATVTPCLANAMTSMPLRHPTHSPLICRYFSTGNRPLYPWENPGLELLKDQSAHTSEGDWNYSLRFVGQSVVVTPLAFFCNNWFFQSLNPSYIDLFVRCFFISWISIGWAISTVAGLYGAGIALGALYKAAKMIGFEHTNKIQNIELNSKTQTITLKTFSNEVYEFKVGEAFVPSLQERKLRCPSFPHDLSFDKNAIAPQTQNLFYQIFYFQSNPQDIFPNTNGFEWTQIGKVEHFQQRRNVIDIEFNGEHLALVLSHNDDVAGYVLLNRYQRSREAVLDRSLPHHYPREGFFPLKIEDGAFWAQLGACYFMEGSICKEQAEIMRSENC